MRLSLNIHTYILYWLPNVFFQLLWMSQMDKDDTSNEPRGSPSKGTVIHQVRQDILFLIVCGVHPSIASIFNLIL